MRNVKYCLSGEFSGSGENSPWDFKFKENIPWETVFYVVHYLIYIQNSLRFYFQGTCLSKACTKPMALGLCFCFAKGVQAQI